MYIKLNKDTTVEVKKSVLSGEYELTLMDYDVCSAYMDLAGLQELKDGLEGFINEETAVHSGQGGPHSAPD